MHYILHSAEELLKELEYCREFKPTNRCLHLPFAKIEFDESELQEFVEKTLRTLTDNLLDFSAKIIICEDRDVFILSRRLTYKIVNEFFALQTPQLLPAQISGLASLFEIGVDWEELEKICKKKLETFKEPEPEAPIKNLQELSMLETFGALDPENIRTLRQRRLARKNIEVMVVEDDPFSRSLINKALYDRHDVSLCADGHSGILSYIMKAPDILFLDIGLPDIDGHKILETISEIDPDAYIVMLSGAGDRDSVLKAMQNGAKGFIGKPFSIEKLIQYISQSPSVKNKIGSRVTGKSIH